MMNDEWKYEGTARQARHRRVRRDRHEQILLFVQHSTFRIQNWIRAHTLYEHTDGFKNWI
jgi:hypothetical protein